MISPGEMMKILATEAAKVAAGCAAPAGSEVLLPYQKRWISDANLMRRMMASREFGRRIAALWYPPNDYRELPPPTMPKNTTESYGG